jgi:hypothetical protein
VIDLASIKTLQQAELDLRHPATGESIGVWFVLAGPEHPTRKRTRLTVARRMRDSLLGGAGLDDDQAEAAAETDVLVASTLGWHGPVVDGVQTSVTLGGAPLPYSAEAARTLYENPELHWLRQQVRFALDRAALFIGGSPSA